MAEAYFREHGSEGFVSDLEGLLAATLPPAGFTPAASPAKREHRGKAVANANARGFAALMGSVPRSGRG